MLIELKTKLKSLKFGTTDKPGGNALEDTPPNQGSEDTNKAGKLANTFDVIADKIGTFGQQPYIRKEIPNADGSFVDSRGEPILYTGPGILGTGGPDIFIRGGVLSATRAAKDVSRLTQMFLNPGDGARGIQYTIKENILSKTSVRTEASKGPLNQGTYTPLSTIVQGAANAFGGHVNHLGLLPFDNVPGTIPKYEKVFHSEIEGDQNLEKNRLFVLSEKNKPLKEDKNLLGKIGSFIAGTFGDTEYFPNATTILKYPGGPSSIAGVGGTSINTAQYTIGKRWDGSVLNKKDYGVKLHTVEDSKKFNHYATFENNPNRQGVDGDDYIIGAYNLESVDKIEIGNELEQLRKINPKDSGSQSVFTRHQPTINQNKGRFQLNTSLLGKRSKNNSSVKNGGEIDYEKLNPSDFRKDLISFEQAENNNTSKVLSLSPAYNDFKKNIHGRVNLGDPGKRNTKNNKNVFNYSADNLEALDKITASPIISTSGSVVSSGDDLNDLVQFRIASVYNSNGDGSAAYMHFRAFIDSFNDAYTANWNSVNYVGRGDTLYNYGNFGRTRSMDFTVAAQSKPELMPMYNKLNYLASTLAPDYSKSGFMRGNIIRLTVGGYIREQHGFLSNLTYSVPQESPWEIAIKSDWEEFGSRGDSSVKELPHVIKVQMTFTPIHNFLPQKVQNDNKQKYILGNGLK